MENKHEGTIKKISGALAEKKVSCEEITKKYLEEIKKSSLNAYVKVCEETALNAAKKVDDKISSGEKLGALEGVPMTI